MELAQCCSKMRQVLETTTKKKDFGGLSELLEKVLENLEMYVRLGWSSLPIMTSSARALWRIESKIPDRAPGAYHSQEHRSGTIEVSPALWEAELRNVLEVIGVCGHLFRLW